MSGENPWFPADFPSFFGVPGTVYRPKALKTRHCKQGVARAGPPWQRFFVSIGSCETPWAKQSIPASLQ